MEHLDIGMSLAELVERTPAAMRVFSGHGLDFCCGGHRTLADACSAHGLSASAVLQQLEAASPEPAPEWATMDPATLVDHLESTHHAELHAQLPTLGALAEKVASVHGRRRPELIEVYADVVDLIDELVPHLAKEERVLFPMIRRLAAGEQLPVPGPPSVDMPITVMMLEHDRAGELLATMRVHARDYVLPDDACGSYRALYSGLAELEADTHLHVHKENNVLFPAVRALEAATPGQPGDTSGRS